MFKTSPEFKKHSENLAAVRKSLTQIERAHKRAIRSGDKSAIKAMSRMHALTIGVLAEATLRKIVTDPNGFNDRERLVIWGVRAQSDRWVQSVELAFRRHFSIPIHRDIDDQNVPEVDLNRFTQIVSLLESDLRPVIEDRNKTAHGQWVWHLKSGKENDFKADQPARPLNYLSLLNQSKLIGAIAELVYILSVSSKTFDRDYMAIVDKLDAARAGLSGDDYHLFVTSLRPAKANGPARP